MCLEHTHDIAEASESRLNLIKHEHEVTDDDKMMIQLLGEHSVPTTKIREVLEVSPASRHFCRKLLYRMTTKVCVQMQIAVVISVKMGSLGTGCPMGQ